MISADLKDAALSEIFQQIDRQSNIVFKCDESVLNVKVSVRFENQYLEDGLKRILASMNHSFLFDKHGILKEVLIIGKKDGNYSKDYNHKRMTENSPALTPVKNRDLSSRKSGSASSNKKRKYIRPSDRFKVIKNSGK